MSSESTSTGAAGMDPRSAQTAVPTASIAEMRRVCQLQRPNAKGKMVWAGHWLNSLATRHISIYFTWLFVRLGISANATTFLMIPTGLLGFALLVPHLLWANVAGYLLLLFAIVLDCVDGEIARWTQKSSVKGYYLDYVYHVLCNSTVYALCALHLYVWQGDRIYLILAFITYAAAQSSLALAIVYNLVLTRIPAPSKPVSAAPQAGRGNLTAVVRLWANRLLFDNYVTEAAVAGAILLTYAGVTWPLLFMAWGLAGFRVVFVVSQTAYRYFYLLPDAAHRKAV